MFKKNIYFSLKKKKSSDFKSFFQNFNIFSNFLEFSQKNEKKWEKKFPKKKMQKSRKYEYL
jgi:hypothetical protein